MCDLAFNGFYNDAAAADNGDYNNSNNNNNDKNSNVAWFVMAVRCTYNPEVMGSTPGWVVIKWLLLGQVTADR